MSEAVSPAKSPRASYIERLYKIEAKLRSKNDRLTSEARRELAVLRRSLVSTNQFGAYSIILQDNVPEIQVEELEVWVLVGGLFALHPLISRAGRDSPRSFGAAMGALRINVANNASIDRRMDQLLGLNRQSLPHYLRQAIRLLSANNIAVHYGQLLDDLVVLLVPPHWAERAAKVRLKWAREYHMPASAPQTDTDPDTAEASESPEKTQ